MKACEIFQHISPTLGTEIIRYLRTDLKEVYRAAVTTLAQQKKLRPEFVQKKPGDQQIAWILDSLRFKSSEAVGEQILQVWLMKAEAPMLVTFLDALEVPHDGNGGIDGDIPKDFDPAKARAAVAALLEKHPAEKAAVYLNIFQLQQAGGWPAITEAVTAHPNLKLGS
jgi:hypothetical protein